MIYRIMTEDIKGTDKIASRYFQGFSVRQQTGYWNGLKEKSICIEIVADQSEEPKVMELCAQLKKKNAPESALMQKLDYKTDFI